MADDFDMEMMDRELPISQAMAKNQAIKFTGHCLYCNEALSAGRFCKGEDCGEQWELEQKMKYLAGRK